MRKGSQMPKAVIGMLVPPFLFGRKGELLGIICLINCNVVSEGNLAKLLCNGEKNLKNQTFSYCG